MMPMLRYSCPLCGALALTESHALYHCAPAKIHQVWICGKCRKHYDDVETAIKCCYGVD